MKLYTSYWAQVRNFPKDLIGLNTTRFPPRWRSLGQDKNGIWVIDCPILKPGKDCDGLCDGKCNPKHPKDCQFLNNYYGQLMKIDFNKFMDSLFKLYEKICSNENLKDVNFAFIFFEKYDNPCSERWPLKSWLQYYNIQVEEWGFKCI